MPIKNLLSEHLSLMKETESKDKCEILDSLRERAQQSEKLMLENCCDLSKYLQEGEQSILSYGQKYSTDMIVESLLVDMDIDVSGIDVLAWCQYCNHLAFRPYYKRQESGRTVRWYKRGRRPTDLIGSQIEEVNLFDFGDNVGELDESKELLIVERKLLNALSDIDSSRVLSAIIETLPTKTAKIFLSVLNRYESNHSPFAANA